MAGETLNWLPAQADESATMGANRHPIRALCTLAALVVCWPASPALAQSAPAAARSILIAPASMDPSLKDVALGLEAWLAARFRSVGFATVPRAALHPHLPAERAEALPPDRMVDVAAKLGAAYVVFSDVRSTSGQVEVRLRISDVATRALIAGARSTAALRDVGEACETSATGILTALGVPVDLALPPQLEELAASGRALRLADRGDLYGAWTEVAHRLWPTAAATREDVVRSALDPRGGSETSLSARARVLAAAGQPDQAWPLIESAVKRELAQPKPDVQILLAAAEVAFARSNVRGARRYVDKLLDSGAEDADVYRAHARILLEANDTVQARSVLSKAIRLAPDDPQLAQQLAELEGANRPRQAELLMLAARGEAANWNIDRAERLLVRAVQVEPGLAAESWRSRGELQSALGRPAESLEAYRKAVEVGGGDVASWRGIGDAERLLGQDDAALQSYAEALALEPDDPGALYGLGSAHLALNEPAKAVPLLTRSVDATPLDLIRRRNLAQALRATGDIDAALRVLRAAPEPDPRNHAQTLRLIAEIQRASDEHTAARDTLVEAARLDPFDPDIQEALVSAYESTGDADAAARARELTAQLRGHSDSQLHGAGQGSGDGMRFGPSLDAIVASFVGPSGGTRGQRVMLLGIRNADSWRERAYTWLHPRQPDFEAITNSLDLALARSFDLAGPPELDNPVLVESIDRLYDFDSRESLDAINIAALNQLLETDAVFVAQLTRAPETPGDAPPGSACADPERFELAVRMLSGQHSDVVGVLQNRQCIPAGFGTHGQWNLRASGAWGLVVLLLCFPVIRGWGRVLVTIDLPPKSKGFFAIRVAKSAGDLPAERSQGPGSRPKLSLRSLSRYERNMVGRQTLFRWIPARPLAYHVTVRGPLMDAVGQEIVGHFLETQKVRVSRGKTAEIGFDFNPKESGVEIAIQMGKKPVPMARIACKGDPDSIRYAREGSTVVPLGAGTHHLLIGAADRVAERVVQIENLGRAVQLVIELMDENGLVFKDCPAAVEPYLMGDYQTAADALAAAGQDQAAHIVRASFLKAIGSTEAAAEEFEAAGFIEEAAEMRAKGADVTGSARLFEQAGDYDRAGEAFHAAGDLESAARCYEAAYDWDNALDCYRESGNDAKVVELLEKSGDYFEAGNVCLGISDPDRALMNLQQVETRDANYGNACMLIADILEARGDVDVAADKVKEAIECAGRNAPAELHERHAELLAKAGQTQLAIGAYRTVRRIDPQRRDLNERIAELERLEEAPSAAGGAAGGAAESRYEILGELGRGAMGVVYKARDRNLGRVVALKRLPENLSAHPTAVALFKREAQAAAALNHRNIVTVFDAGEENGSYFITMELLEGMPLNQILKKRGRLKVSDTARLGIQIAAGLQYAKENRIVHRDIKTGNLFFTKDRTVKIMDFGLAKTIEEVRKASTMIGGTPYFMAPEQAIGDELDHRADLYAFGVTLYQLVTGTVPFRDGDLTYHHRHTPPPDPRTHVPAIPAAMAELILQMLEKKPDDRPADAAAVATRLQAILNTESASGA